MQGTQKCKADKKLKKAKNTNNAKKAKFQTRQRR